MTHLTNEEKLIIIRAISETLIKDTMEEVSHKELLPTMELLKNLAYEVNLLS